MGPPRPSRTERLACFAALALAAVLALPVDLPAEDTASNALDWGFRLRLRQEYLNNVYDFNDDLADDSNYLRIRSQLWGSWTLSPQWKLYAMLNNEHRHWFKSTKGLEKQDFEPNEIIFENLYIEGKKLGGTPFGFILGRQNIMYGEGFICWDGGPLDGSRTAYFNALLVNAVFGARRFEAHVISDPTRDDYLPVINNQDQKLVEWKETGAGIYYTDESIEGKKLEAYYFFKNEARAGDSHPESDIHTIGARVSGTLEKRFTFAAEGAVQLGDAGVLVRDMGGRDRLAYGGYVTLSYAVERRGVPFNLSAGSILLSGDDPHTYDRVEGWNPMYARWPKWSDLMVYSLTGEGGPAYWQNLGSLWLGARIEPAKRFYFDGRYYFMRAMEPLLECAYGPSISEIEWCVGRDVTRRGDLSVLKAGVNWNRNVGGYVLWEALRPGPFDTERTGGTDTAHFLRWEILIAF